MNTKDIIQMAKSSGVAINELEGNEYVLVATGQQLINFANKLVEAIQPAVAVQAEPGAPATAEDKFEPPYSPARISD